MARFYVLLLGEITRELVEYEIKRFLWPHGIDFKRTEWFSTFEGMIFLEFWEVL